MLATNVSNGSLTLSANGSFSYTPNLNIDTSDSFTYYANDGPIIRLPPPSPSPSMP